MLGKWVRGTRGGTLRGFGALPKKSQKGIAYLSKLMHPGFVLLGVVADWPKSSPKINAVEEFTACGGIE